MRLALPLLGLLFFNACGEESVVPVQVLPLDVRGAAIDGSDDVIALVPKREVVVDPGLEARGKAPGDGLVALASEGEAPADPVPDPMSAAPKGEEAPADAAPSANSTQPESTALIVSSNPPEPASDVALAASAPELPEAEPQPETKPEPETAPEPETEQREPIPISYRDLSLMDYDVDAMLDYMLFPEEYEGEEVADLQFPPALKKLDGKVVSIVGYMIPGEMDQGNVRDFMLVRDLLGCCFGGTPMPDEWLDVIMEEDAEAVYRPYMPTRVTGRLTLGGDQDEAGFALGVYKLKGTKVTVED